MLALAADIVFELGNQRQNPHDQLAGARACVNGEQLSTILPKRECPT